MDLLKNICFFKLKISYSFVCKYLNRNFLKLLHQHLGVSLKSGNRGLRRLTRDFSLILTSSTQFLRQTKSHLWRPDIMHASHFPILF